MQIHQLPDHCRLGSRDRDRQRLALSGHVGAIVFRAVDHYAVSAKTILPSRVIRVGAILFMVPNARLAKASLQGADHVGRIQKIRDTISRVAPAICSFEFQSADEFKYEVTKLGTPMRA